MQKKILFLHGFYASGSCVPALALKEAFDGKATVLTPDLPLHPADAITLIRDICDKEKPDVLVGNSCGSFYAQMISPIIGVPALLGNPHFDFVKQSTQNVKLGSRTPEFFPHFRGKFWGKIGFLGKNQKKVR